MTGKLSVAVVGISDREQGVLGQAARFSRARERSYELCSNDAAGSADLLVANDDESALERARTLMNGRSAVSLIVISDRTSSDHSVHLLKRPLLISRVLRVLDQASADLSPLPAQPAGETAPGQGMERERKESAVDETGKAAHSGTSEPQQQPPVTDTVPQARMLEAEQSQLVAGAGAAPAVAEGDHAASIKALVVDDSLAIRKQLELELREAAIAADFAETGEQALELAADNNYDLVFLDIMMPGIDGYEVCKNLRKAPENKKTPIIMLSGKTSPLDEVQGVLAGASTYLTKPVGHEDFQAVLGRVVKWLDGYKRGG